MTVLFIGNRSLFTVPEGNANAFTCFTVSEQIAAAISFLQFHGGDNTLLKSLLTSSFKNYLGIKIVHLF